MRVRKQHLIDDAPRVAKSPTVFPVWFVRDTIKELLAEIEGLKEQLTSESVTLDHATEAVLSAKASAYGELAEPDGETMKELSNEERFKILDNVCMYLASREVNDLWEPLCQIRDEFDDSRRQSQGEPGVVERLLLAVAEATKEPAGGEWWSLRQALSDCGEYTDDLSGERLIPLAMKHAISALRQPQWVQVSERLIEQIEKCNPKDDHGVHLLITQFKKAVATLNGLPYCVACRQVGALHCAHPEDCGEMDGTTLTQPQWVQVSERLIEQIEKCNLKDDHGHDFKMNDAYIAFKKLTEDQT